LIGAVQRRIGRQLSRQDNFKHMTASKRLLFVFPHPDDETFATGGSIAKYAHEGVEVHYACGTRGEVGTVDAERLKPYEHLPEDQRVGALRGQELRCAADKLGLTGLHYLGYRDSGMTGSPETQDPRALINANADEVTLKLVELIRSIKPHVIVTHDPFGGYGHPDHIFLHHQTTAAFQAAGDPNKYPDAGAPYQPQKLYWHVFPKALFNFLIKASRLLRPKGNKFGRNNDIDIDEIAKHDYPPTTRIDIWPYYSIKQEASQCHVSQLAGSGGGMLDRIPRLFRRRLLGYEHYRLVEPEPNGRRRKEQDLFEDLEIRS
jgi:LmbE family N-acetylglucosaminyl deacetylase